MAFAGFFRAGVTILEGRRYVLSALAWAEHRRDKTLWIDSALCARVAEGAIAEPNVAGKLRLLVEWFAEASGRPGRPVPFGDEVHYPAAFCEDTAEWKYFREEAAKRGLLEPAAVGGGLVVTTVGWEWLERRASDALSVSALYQSDAASKTGPMAADPEWDVFISHASEDKDPFVKTLASTLVARGVRVWLDDHALTLGDSLSQKIDQGLAKSRYGIVVLSKAFFAKHWPQKELAGLVQREVAGRKVILPIWHGVVHADVVGFSPTLADKLAAHSSDGMDSIVRGIFEVLVPPTPPMVAGSAGSAPPKPVEPRYGHRMRANFQGPCSLRKGHEIEIHSFIGPKPPTGSGQLRILKMVDLTDDITYVSNVYNTMMSIQPANVVVMARVAGAISQAQSMVEFDVEMTDEEFTKFQPHAQPRHSASVR